MMTLYEIARRAAWDEGNRSMRKAGRSRWNGEDYEVAFAELDRVLNVALAEEKNASSS